MEEKFSYTKIFTILFSTFYIFGLAASFYNLAFIFAVILLFVLILMTLFTKFDFKRIIILYLIFFVGIIRASNSENIEKSLENVNSNNVKLYGQVVTSKEVSNRYKRVRFYLNVKDIEISGKTFDNLNSKILVSFIKENNSEDNITIGDYIEVKGKLSPAKTAKNPHQFNYRRYLLNNDCINVLYANPLSINKIKEPVFDFHNPADSWYYILKKFEITRHKIILRHAKYIKSPELEILGGIVFGNETINPDEKIKEDFKNSGLLHLLAASGLNVALIFGIWWWIAMLIRIPYNLAILSGAVFVVLYTFMTGFPPSILRASCMLLFVLFGKLIDRNVNSVALVFFVGFLILLFNPKMLFDVGFQLSFIVTIGLIVSCPVIVSKIVEKDKKFKEKFKNSSSFKRYLAYAFCPVNVVSALCVPLVAQLWVVPLQMHYFNNFAIFSVIANIAVIPFIGILSFIGFISSIISLIPYLSGPMIFLFDIIAKPMLTLLVKTSEYFASFKYSMLKVIGLNIFQMFGVWILILLFLLNLKSDFKNKKYLIIFISFVLIFALSFIRVDDFRHNFEIIMFDVENADSFLIKTPNKRYILIDTGRKPYKGLSSGEIILNRYFKNERINKLKTLIITHFDMDHCGGAVDVLNSVKTDEIIIQKDKAKSELSKEILDFIKSNNFNYKIAKNNEIIYSEPDLTVKTLTPVYKNKNDEDKFDNETSIVTLVTYRNKNFLFMGDVGILGFKSIEKYLPDKVDIIKIGHHGAKDVINNEILKRINPDYALISTGINKFGHPHYSTINLLNENKIKTISTRNYGFVRIILDKNLDYKFYHYESTSKKLEKVLFDRLNPIPFNKSKYVQDFIKANL